MYTVRHLPIKAKVGEPVRIVCSVKRSDGVPVIVEDDGTEASYKVARRVGVAALMEKTHDDGITFDGDIAYVDFTTDEIVNGNDQQMVGKFWGQLTISKGGEPLVVLEGEVEVEEIIL